MAAQMERMQTLQKDAPEKYHKQISQEIKDSEEQRFKEDLNLSEKKHRLERLKIDRERARVLEEKEMPVVKGAVTSTTSHSLSPSFEPEMNEEMITPSNEQPSLEKEEGWWNADLEGGKEKLAVKGAVASTASESKNPDRWSPRRTMITRKEVKEWPRSFTVFVRGCHQAQGHVWTRCNREVIHEGSVLHVVGGDVRVQSYHVVKVHQRYAERKSNATGHSKPHLTCMVVQPFCVCVDQ